MTASRSAIVLVAALLAAGCSDETPSGTFSQLDGGSLDANSDIGQDAATPPDTGDGDAADDVGVTADAADTSDTETDDSADAETNDSADAETNDSADAETDADATADAETADMVDAETSGGDADASTNVISPALAGPFMLSTVEDTVIRGDREIPVTAYVPSGGGPVPLVVFHPGFQLESWRYEPLCEHLATHGFVVVRADTKPGVFTVSHVEMAADLIAVIDWATDADGPLGGDVQAEHVGVTGHSLGGKLAAMVADDDPRVDAVLGIDPVNGGAGPLGFTPQAPDILPQVLQYLTIPQGFLGETTNGTGSIIQPACAPEDGNFLTFYDAAQSASWRASWNIEGADHMDFVDDTSNCLFTCGACPDGTADEAEVQELTHTIAAAFFRKHLQGDDAVDPWLTGTLVPSSVAIQTAP